MPSFPIQDDLSAKLFLSDCITLYTVQVRKHTVWCNQIGPKYQNTGIYTVTNPYAYNGMNGMNGLCNILLDKQSKQVLMVKNQQPAETLLYKATSEEIWLKIQDKIWHLKWTF